MTATMTRRASCRPDTVTFRRSQAWCHSTNLYGNTATAQNDAGGGGAVGDSVAMTVNLIRTARLFPGAPYAYAARASQGDLIFTAGACPLDEQGQVVAPGDVRAL